MDAFSDASDGSDQTVESWSTDIETILSNLLENVNELQREHKAKYIALQSQLIYFRVPLIILSSVNSVFSVGLSAYVEQQAVSTINCLISLTCACISSVELFLNIHKNMDTHTLLILQIYQTKHTILVYSVNLFLFLCVRVCTCEVTLVFKCFNETLFEFFF